MTPPRKSFLRPKRRKPLAKRKPVPRTNSKRRNANWARAYHSAERVEWLKSQPCIACGRTPTEGHHITTGGMGRKSGYDQQVPVCRSHHDALHHHGPRTFEALVGVDLTAEAARCEARWLASLDGAA